MMYGIDILDLIQLYREDTLLSFIDKHPYLSDRTDSNPLKHFIYNKLTHSVNKAEVILKTAFIEELQCGFA